MINWKSDRDRILRKLQVKVELYQRGTSTDCTHCGYDLVTKESADASCTYCNGTGKIYGNDTITIIDSNFRELSGESALRRDLGNISQGSSLLYCDSKYKSKIKLAYKIIINEDEYTTYKDADGKLVMRGISDPDGKISRLEVVLVRS